MRTALVVGASGVVGHAVLRHYGSLGDWRAVGVSRRRPFGIDGVEWRSVDLLDASACAASFGEARVDHVVYTALREAPGLTAGWRDRSLMQLNLQMLRNVLEPLAVNSAHAHVSLLQGTKAYGVHLGPRPVPARERWPRDRHDNFYFLQEDYLRERQARTGATFTIWRPQVVYGESFGSPMNLLPVIGAYGALERDAGRPLSFPGGVTGVSEAVDADLLAEAIAWGAGAPAAAGETFNITNGDVVVWRDIWPAIAGALHMDAGPDCPQRLADTMPQRRDQWADLVDRHRLHAPRDLAAFVGDSLVYADQLFGYGNDAPRPPALVSTIKLRQAGFGNCIDSEDMFHKWFDRFRERRLLP